MKKAVALLLCIVIALCSLPIISFADSSALIEAEDYKTNDGVITKESNNTYGDFSGSGYVNLDKAKATYEFSVNKSGYYDISCCCALVGDINGYGVVEINNNKYCIYVDNSGNFKASNLLSSDFSELEYGIYLESGKNTMVVYTNTTDKEKLMPNITLDNNYYNYEIEDGIYDGIGEEFTDSIPNYSGLGAVKLYNGSVTMNIYVPETRYYNILISSCSYDGNNKRDNVIVNGNNYSISTSSDNSSFALSEIGDVYGNKLTSGIKLEKGVNKVVLNANWGYCAYDKIALETVPYVSSMFIVPDLIAPANTTDYVWQESQWNECFARLSEVGVNSVIMQYTAQYWNETDQFFYYNRSNNNYSQPDYQRAQVELSLKAAKQYGMKVYLGLQVAEDLWFSDMANNFNSNFMSESANFSKMVANELWQQFSNKYSEQIAGWYLPFELNNKQVSGQALDRFINNYLKPVTTYLKAMTSDLPIMMSPLVYHDDYTAPASEYYLNVWKNMCSAIWSETPLDIIAPQDGCGWESTCKENLPQWFRALYDVANSETVKNARANNGWGEAIIFDNAESYNMNGIDQMPTNRLVANMNAVAPYVSGFISFSIHYFVPFSSPYVCGTRSQNYLYYNSYKNYYNTKHLITDNSALPTPINLSVVKSNSYDSCVAFDTAYSADNNNPVAGYVIKRKVKGSNDSTAIKITEIAQTTTSTRINYTDYQLDSGVTYTYIVYSFDAYGNRCIHPAVADFTVGSSGFELNRIYTDVVSNSKPVSVENIYNITSDANSNVLFTDGLAGKKIEDWGTDRPAWCGFLSNVYNGAYSLTVSNLETTSIGYVYLAMLSQKEIGVNLPYKIEAYVDGVSSPIATVYPNQAYKPEKSGNVWVGVNLGKAYNTNSVRLVITQYDEWTMLSEIRIIGANSTLYDNNDPVNLAGGKPVYLSDYSSYGNSFGFNDHKTYSATVDNCAPGVSYYMDETQTQMAGLSAMGDTYKLTVNFDSATTVNMIGSRWTQDENLGIYIPDSIDYYGVTSSGRTMYLTTVHRASKPQLDWMYAPNENLRAAKISEFKTLVNSSEKFISVQAIIHPKYTNGWTFFDNFYVY